jgi:hypothetical protein
MKQAIFKAIIVSTKDYKIIDIENIKSTDLKHATVLVRDVQLAELKQEAKDFDEHKEAYVCFKHKIGIVEDVENSIMFVIGKDNGWFDLLDKQNEWIEIVQLEWEDYIRELLTLEEHSTELVEV